MRALLADDFLESYGQRENFRTLFVDVDVRGQLTGRDPLHQSLYLWAKTGLPTYILTMLGDRMEMAHSVERRVPFLDHHVVEVICSQPVSQKIRGGTEKFVLREAVRDVITDTVYKRQKHPFLSPPATLCPEQKLSTFVQDTLRGPVFSSIPYFDQKKVLGLLDALPTMEGGSRVAYDQVLMLLVALAFSMRDSVWQCEGDWGQMRHTSIQTALVIYSQVVPAAQRRALRHLSEFAGVGTIESRSITVQNPRSNEPRRKSTGQPYHEAQPQWSSVRIRSCLAL